MKNMRGLFLLLTMATATIGFGISDGRADDGMRAGLSPTMQEASQAFRRHDYKTSAALLRVAAAHGDVAGQVTLARMYFKGWGVPIDYVQSLRLLKAVIARNQEPTLSVARENLREISDTLRNSPNPQDKQLAMIADLLPLTAHPLAKQVEKNMENTKLMTCIGMVCW